jgi:hypothetical protein
MSISTWRFSLEKIGALKPDYASMPWSMGDSLPFEGKGGKEWVRYICIRALVVIVVRRRWFMRKERSDLSNGSVNDEKKQ